MPISCMRLASALFAVLAQQAVGEQLMIYNKNHQGLILDSTCSMSDPTWKKSNLASRLIPAQDSVLVAIKKDGRHLYWKVSRLTCFPGECRTNYFGFPEDSATRDVEFFLSTQSFSMIQSVRPLKRDSCNDKQSSALYRTFDPEKFLGPSDSSKKRPVPSEKNHWARLYSHCDKYELESGESFVFLKSHIEYDYAIDSLKQQAYILRGRKPTPVQLPDVERLSLSTPVLQVTTKAKQTAIAFVARYGIGPPENLETNIIAISDNGETEILGKAESGGQPCD